MLAMLAFIPLVEEGQRSQALLGIISYAEAALCYLEEVAIHHLPNDST